MDNDEAYSRCWLGRILGANGYPLGPVFVQAAFLSTTPRVFPASKSCVPPSLPVCAVSVVQESWG